MCPFLIAAMRPFAVVVTERPPLGVLSAPVTMFVFRSGFGARIWVLPRLVGVVVGAGFRVNRRGEGGEGGEGGRVFRRGALGTSSVSDCSASSSDCPSKNPLYLTGFRSLEVRLVSTGLGDDWGSESDARRVVARDEGRGGGSRTF